MRQGRQEAKINDPQFDWLDSCPLCQGTGLTTWEVSEGGYSVQPVRVRCRDCGLIFSNPQASEARLKNFYEKVYFARPEFKAAYLGPEEEALQRRKARAELEWLERRVKPSSLLDVGAASGYFLLEARTRGWSAEGVEMSREAVGRARKRGLKVYHGRLEDLKLKKRYAVVRAAHTLEHVKDPHAFLGAMRGLLAPGGRLLVEVPNARHLWALIWHYGAILRGRVPPLRFAKEHTFDFTARTLSRLHARAGLKVLRARNYEYPGGALNLWRKRGDNPLKAAARFVFVALAKGLRLESAFGSYLQILSEAER